MHIIRGERETHTRETPAADSKSKAKSLQSNFKSASVGMGFLKTALIIYLGGLIQVILLCKTVNKFIKRLFSTHLRRDLRQKTARLILLKVGQST
jgi:hypothetical protein